MTEKSCKDAECLGCSGPVTCARRYGRPDALGRVPLDPSVAQLTEDMRRDLRELHFYRQWGYPYIDHSTMFDKDHQGLYAITLPLSLPHPQGEGTCATTVIRAFCVLQLYQKAVKHVATIQAEHQARYGVPR